MTQTTDRKTKITGWQAPVSVNTYGIYLTHRILTGMIWQMIVPRLPYKNVKILETSTIIFLEIDNTLLHL